MWKCFIIVLVFLISTLVLLQYVSFPLINNHFIRFEIAGFTVNNVIDHSDNSINLGFSAFAYEEAKREEIEREQFYDLTAILLHWQRLGGIQKTLQYLLSTGLFKQIIIWNNNPNINLTLDDLFENHSTNDLIRIINSKENLKDEAKYRGCAEAKTRACFYVDDDWDVSSYLRSLIASFRSDPSLLHAITDTYTYFTNLVWSYFDKEIDLHSGFSWIGCGSVFLRQHAEKHLQLVHKYLKDNTELIPLSDVFFSIWLNDIPAQMHTNIRPQHSKSSRGAVSFSSTPRFAQLQYTSSVTAIRTLEHSLRFGSSNNSDNITFTRQQNRRFPIYIKSPSYKDELTFYTNILTFQMENVPFNISQDYERGTRKNLPRGPNVEKFSVHSTWHAVDNDLSTCWHTTDNIRSNDFFAIDFLSVQTNIIFKLIVTHSQQLHKQLDLRISFDGLEWLSYRSFNGIYIKTNQTVEPHIHTYLYDASEFNVGFNSFRYISFKVNNDSDDRLQVCEIGLISKDDITKFKRYFNPLNI